MRTDLWATAKASFPPLLALSALAIAQPLLDLFGRNPEFFVASDMTKPDVLAFGAAAAFLVPVVALVVVLAAGVVGGRRAARWATHAFVAMLAFAFGLRVAREIDMDRTLFAGAVGAGIAVLVTVLRIRSEGFRHVLRYLALAPVAFLGLFVLGSESSKLLFDSDASAATGVTVGKPAPIVFIVLDEVPAASLMRPDGTLNEERFPNFARLADAGTWYRNASAVAPNTPNAVPSLLDGNMPVGGDLPVSADHPANLFTLLGESYDLDVTETVTELCPSSLCADESADGSSHVRRVGRSLFDAAIVLGHTLLPPRLSESLPAVDRAWGRFADPAAPAVPSSTPRSSVESRASERQTSASFLLDRLEDGTGRTSDVPGETLLRSVLDWDIDSDTDLLFVHEVFPHRPWVRTPNGRSYENRPAPRGQDGSVWNDENEFLLTQALQRHLLQLGYADAILGELIDKLEDDGAWDDALVVIAADHGISFDLDEPVRSPTDGNATAVYGVPLFIKSPGGVGRVDDEPARAIDILPTIVDILEVETDLTFDGVSLVGDHRATDRPVAYHRGPAELEGGLETTVAIARRNAARLGSGDGWRSVVAIGPYGRLVGKPLDEIDVSDGPARSWSIDQADDLESVEAGGAVPLILTGEIEGGARGSESLLVAANGTVAGVVGFEDGEGPDAYSVLLDEAVLVDGDNEVELLAVTGRPSDPDVVLLGPPG